MPTPRSLRMVSFSASFCWLGCSTERDMVVLVGAPPPPASSRPVPGPRPPPPPPLSGLLPSRPRPPPQGSAPMALAPQFRAGDRASRGGRLGGSLPRSSPRPDSLRSFRPPPFRPHPRRSPPRAPPLGVAAAAAAAPPAEDEAASRSPGRALGHLIARAGAPARQDGELHLRASLRSAPPRLASPPLRTRRRPRPARPARPARCACFPPGALSRDRGT